MYRSPLVSCIMPTRNRRRFVPKAIDYFLRQSYEPRELLVIDDGDDATGDAIAGDARIRYVHLPARATVGAKRNIACEAGRGELIAHWDDDDWFGAERLAVQIEALLVHGGDACGTRSFRCLRLREGDAWTYRPAHDDAPWVAGATLVYRRSAWERNHFPAASSGEDTTFVRRLGIDRVCVLDDLPSYVAVRHGANTSAFNVGDRRWTPLALTRLAVVLGGDWTFYRAES